VAYLLSSPQTSFIESSTPNIIYKPGKK